MGGETFWLSEWIPQIPWGDSVWGNAWGSYAEALIVFVISFIIFKILHHLAIGSFVRFAKKTKTDLDDTVVEVIKSLRPPFYIFLAFAIAVGFLELPEIVGKVVSSVLVIWVVYQIVIAVQILINRIFGKRGDEKDLSHRNAMRVLGTFAKVLLWIFGGLFVLSNLGVEITSLIAGLGIGGIAVAFALQNILGDLFSSFALYFDKPFQVGDFIVVGDYSGVVERIGIKTTRVRALRGEEVVISNRELTSARVQNFRKLKERRVEFSLGVLYETEEEKLEKIPQIIKEVIKSVSNVKFDRVHFREFGDSALLFEIVFFVESDDYNLYMDVRQEINLGIKKRFDAEGIGFAYPTQTLYVQKS